MCWLFCLNIDIILCCHLLEIAVGDSVLFLKWTCKRIIPMRASGEHLLGCNYTPLLVKTTTILHCWKPVFANSFNRWSYRFESVHEEGCSSDQGNECNCITCLITPVSHKNNMVRFKISFANTVWYQANLDYPTCCNFTLFDIFNRKKWCYWLLYGLDSSSLNEQEQKQLKKNK